MKNCIRCGKEIDVISRNPEKVFYCRSCSLKMMNLTEDDLEVGSGDEYIEESNFWIILIKVIKSFIPGIAQVLEKEILKGLIFFFSGLVLPISWIFLTIFLAIIGLDEAVKFALIILGILIFINALIVFIRNLLDVWKRGEN